jgi:hypothetical protein
LKRALGALTVVWLIASCGVETVPAASKTDVSVSRSSTLLLNSDESSLWVVSPDDDRVIELDPNTLAMRRTLSVSGAPGAIAWAGDRLVVSRSLAPSIGVIDVSTGGLTEVAIPCSGASGVVTNGEDVFVNCRDDVRVARVSLLDATPVWWSVTRPVDGMIRIGSRLWIAGGGALYNIRIGHALDNPAASLETLADTTEQLAPDQRHSASQIRAIDVGPDGAPIVVFQAVQNDGDRERDPQTGGYGSVHEGEPRLQPRVAGPCGGYYATFDGGERVFSGPAAARWVGGTLWVTHQYTQNVAVLSCNADDELALVKVFRAGAGAAGIAVSTDEKTAWVDLAFEGGVARLSLDGGAEPPHVRRRPVTALRWSDQALEGRRLFHDARRSQLTSAGVVTCASCHPDGGEDGLGWFIHTPTIAPKFRRTPPAWMGRSDLLPLHWDSEFKDARELVGETVAQLMGGTGNLVDLDSIVAYMGEIPLPGVPATDSEAEWLCRERGAQVFEAAACRTCHTGPQFSDGLAHTIRLAPSDPDGLVGPVQTPSLLGVRARAPWLHDASALTLSGVWTDHDPEGRHGLAATLPTPEFDALICYLKSL